MMLFIIIARKNRISGIRVSINILALKDFIAHPYRRLVIQKTQQFEKNIIYCVYSIEIIYL